MVTSFIYAAGFRNLSGADCSGPLHKMMGVRLGEGRRVAVVDELALFSSTPSRRESRPRTIGMAERASQA